MSDGWKKIKGNWYYQIDGKSVTGWQKLKWSQDTNWFFFDSQGLMQTGWQKLKWSQGTSWFYFDEKTGAMLTGDQYLEWKGTKSWYSFDETTGAMINRSANTQTGNTDSVYSVFVIDGAWTYNITDVVENIALNQAENQLAASAEITLLNIKIQEKDLNAYIKERDRVFIYASDGSKKEEVFRGYIWTKTYKQSISDKTLQIKCFDNLIYLQESEESDYYSSGSSTKSVMASICKKWGITINYNYGSITHSKLVLRGNLADIITSDILDKVKDRTGKKYVISSVKDVMQINQIGSNKTIYTIKDRENAISAQRVVTMEGMITRVKILGPADKNDQRPVEAVVSGKTSKYGTLQKVIDKDKDTSLADAKKEAETILKEFGEPKNEYTVTAPDIPWIRKGDKVKVQAGDINKILIVAGISHDITNKEKKMDLTLTDQ